MTADKILHIRGV